MPIKRIFSAGGIVIRDGKVLVTQHSKHKGWDFPKGHIEGGELQEQAAVREVEEETGVKAEIIEKIGQTEYFYYEEIPHSVESDSTPRGKQPHSAKATRGEKVLKTVAYYLMKYIGEGETTTAFEVSAMEWLDPEEVEGKLTFKDTKELWGEVVERVKRIEDRTNSKLSS